jgi:hypothetical protein
MMYQFQDGDLAVVVESEPGKNIRIGTGTTHRKAECGLITTPLQWRPGILPHAIKWAAYEGWVSQELADEVDLEWGLDGDSHVD